MQKLITFTVPAYNAEGYLKTCIESLLPAGEEAEIVIVDDGSADRTGAIADEYAMRYPSVVRAVHQPNGGHGAGVNAGLACAEGLYFKVVDSDDWLDAEGLRSLLGAIRAHVHGKEMPDLYVADFVYEHVQDGTRYTSSFRKQLPKGRMFSWEEAKPMRLWKVLLMHALVYRTQLLRECGLRLPEHTFYVDNLFAYTPFPSVKRAFYLGCTLYHYFIGRSDQSVTIRNVVGRYEQQIRVMSLVMRAHPYHEFLSDEHLFLYDGKGYARTQAGASNDVAGAEEGGYRPFQAAAAASQSRLSECAPLEAERKAFHRILSLFVQARQAWAVSACNDTVRRLFRRRCSEAHPRGISSSCHRHPSGERGCRFFTGRSFGQGRNCRKLVRKNA